MARGGNVFKSALSESRLLGYDAGGRIRLNCQDSSTGAWHERHLEPTGFLRRWSLHVLPKGLMRVRHYGFLSSAGKKRRERVARIPGVQPPELPRWPRILTKRDLPRRMAVAPCRPPPLPPLTPLTPLTPGKKPVAASRPVPAVARPWSSCAGSSPWIYGSARPSPLRPPPLAGLRAKPVHRTPEAPPTGHAAKSDKQPIHSITPD